MKQFTFLLVIISLGSLINPVKAQEFYCGLTGGMNMADMKIIGDGEEQDVNPLNLLGIGGIFGIRFDNHFSLQLRPLYLQKGGILDQDLPSPDMDFRMSFFELDLSLKAALGNQIRPYVLAGPTLGFLLTAEVETEAAGNVMKADLKDVSQKIEYGLSIGAGIEFSLWKGFLFVEGRYVFGLNNLNKGGPVEFKLNDLVVDTAVVDEEDTYKNRGIQIMAGFAFSLTKK